MNKSIPKAIPSSVAFSADNSVKVNDTALRGPYQPATGKSINPKVPQTPVEGELPPQPYFTGGKTGVGSAFLPGSHGAPSVPTDGFLFRSPPIDSHYLVEAQERNPYSKVNALHTVGWNTLVAQYPNHVGHHQWTTETGFKVTTAQQRTSYMRAALPPVGNFGVQTFQPRPQPQAVRYNRIRPSIGTDPYGTGVLNRDTFGAGQTYGGQGGNNYSPAPGPPPTNSVSNPAVAEPTLGWG